VKDALPQGGDFELVDGKLTAEVRTIDAGRKHEFEYVIIPRRGDLNIAAPPAEVAYSSPGRGKVTGLSSSPYVVVLSPAQNAQLYLVEVVCFPRAPLPPLFSA
jgi:Translocon-associated protein beta (TRAPB)